MHKNRFGKFAQKVPRPQVEVPKTSGHAATKPAKVKKKK